MNNEPKFVPYEETLVKNFAIHNHEKVSGTKSTGSDIMLTFGSTISPLDVDFIENNFDLSGKTGGYNLGGS